MDVKLFDFRKQKLGKTAHDAKCKNIIALLDGNAKKRLRVLEEDNSLVHFHCFHVMGLLFLIRLLLQFM